MHVFSIVAILALGGLFAPPIKEGFYLDPGSGSFILQLIVASVVGGLVIFRGYIARLFSFLRKSDPESEEQEPVDNDE
jgi:hypothetical protein